MKKLLLLLILIGVFSCKQEDVIPEFSLDQADLFTSDEYAVYSLILKDFGFSQIVVRQETSIQIPLQENFELFFNLDKMSNMESTLYSKYLEANTVSYKLDKEISIPGKGVEVISNNEYAYYFEREDLYKAWTLFKNKYPNSGSWYFSVNKIGFNENKTQAIVGVESFWFMESPDGPTLKSGLLNYLEKKNGVWEKVGSTSYAL
jgi:hypothetical protein